MLMVVFMKIFIVFVLFILGRVRFGSLLVVELIELISLVWFNVWLLFELIFVKE